VTDQVYVYAWGNNERRAALEGRLCVIEARGAMRTVLVRFLDNGERVTTSIRALRKVEAFQPGNAISRENGGGGNRTRVTSQPDAADLQGDRKSDPAESPRPRLCDDEVSLCAEQLHDASPVDARRGCGVIHAVAAAIRGYSFRYATEEALQAGLADALEATGFDVQREVRLDARSRLDLLVGRVAVEVKVAGSTRGVRAQLVRYLMSDAIDGVVLVTNRVRHLALPSAAFGKPIVVVDLVGAGL
jgi:hypothetical protein